MNSWLLKTDTVQLGSSLGPRIHGPPAMMGRASNPGLCFYASLPMDRNHGSLKNGRFQVSGRECKEGGEHLIVSRTCSETTGRLPRTAQGPVGRPWPDLGDLSTQENNDGKGLKHKFF